MAIPALFAQAQLLHMLMGPWIAQAVGAVARLGVADQLAVGPKSASDIAAAVGAHPESLRRTLRALSTVGLFSASGRDCWALTEVGQCLRTDVPGSMRYMAIAETDHAHWIGWDRFIDAVRTGQPQAEAALGCPPWDYYAKHPADGEAFSRAMANISLLAVEPILGSYDFSGAEVIADIGGAYGALLAAILRKEPKARGVLFDRPNIVQGATDVLGDVAARTELLGGDFLVDALPSANLYLLKHILHDWSDTESLKILRAVRAAMAPGARVLIIEFVIAEPALPGPAALMDLNMMVMLGGMERTSAEYAALLEQAGLTLQRTVHTPSPYAILEAVASRAMDTA
jgi:hypothetical protein